MASLLLLPSPIRASATPPPPTKQSIGPAGTAVAAPAAEPLRHRPAVILPGLGNNSQDYGGLVSSLGSHGVSSVVADVSRVDWLRNAAGLTDARYWKGTLRPRPVLDWYLKRVDAAVAEAKQLAQGGSVSIIGHSAGGWLARVFMEEFGDSGISLLLTLGTPHLPPPRGVPGVIDQTRGLLYYVQDNCQPAVYSPEMKYVCIAGRYIEGAPLLGKSGDSGRPQHDAEPSLPAAAAGDESSSGERSAGSTAAAIVRSSSPTIRARFVGQGYKQVCGRADVWGDGVVPEVSAHLEGALNVSLDGVYHSPVGSDDERRPWYGSPSVLETWVHHLLD